MLGDYLASCSVSKHLPNIYKGLSTTCSTIFSDLQVSSSSLTKTL